MRNRGKDRSAPLHKAADAGFTVVELLIYMIVAVVVITAVYQLLIGQNRLYMKQRELQDVRSTIRAAASFLAFEFRQASAVGGDLYSIAEDSFTVRSLQGAGIVCGKHASQSRVGLWRVTGEFEATSADSTLVLALRDEGTSDDSWVRGMITQVWGAPSAGGVNDCDWGGGGSAEPELVIEILGDQPPDYVEGEITIAPLGEVEAGAGWVTFEASHPDLACGDFDSRADLDVDADEWDYEGSMSGCTFNVYIDGDAEQVDIQIDLAAEDYPQLSGDANGVVTWNLDGSSSSEFLDLVTVGAPLRAFRRTQYGIYQEGGRWWLGRKVGSSASYERLTGPLRAPADSGLKFTYYDESGATTTVPAQVRLVDVVIRGESIGKVPRGGGMAPTFQQDTLTIRVKLRG